MNNKTQEQLNISDETMRSIKEFFLKTSIPRILAKKEKVG